MNITLLIGNGFDMALGLDTSYASFLRSYVEKPTSDVEVQAFRSRLREEINASYDGISSAKYEKWSNCELAKGADTAAFQDPDSFCIAGMISCSNYVNICKSR